MMLPDRALIVCQNPDEANELLDFLESCGALWGSTWSAQRGMDYKSAHYYDNSPDKELCYNLTNNVAGFCHTKWYQQNGQEYENHDDPSWNYITVDEFVEKCDSGHDEISLSLEGLL